MLKLFTRSSDIRRRKYRNGNSFKRRTSTYEHLEDRRLLAITWANETTINFGALGLAALNVDEQTVRTTINRAIDDWEKVITDFNYDGDNNPSTNNNYNLTLGFQNLGNSRGNTATTFNGAGLPTQATVTIDDNGGGLGWYFDSTPLDDAEFTAIANTVGALGTSFQGTFAVKNGSERFV